MRCDAKRRTIRLGFGLWALGLGVCFAIACEQARERGGSNASAASRGPVTFNRDVAPILLDNCATCHRPVASVQTGRVSSADTLQPATTNASPPGDPLCIAGAPFSVLDYASVHRNAQRIAAATKARAMPPWLPEPGHGRFVGERRLRDDQIQLIQQWVAQGAPEGAPADKAPSRSWPEGWQLGTPDLVLDTPAPYTLRPGDGDVFRNFVIPVPATARTGRSGPTAADALDQPDASTRYVRAIEFRAGNQRVLHHANIGLDAARVSRRLDRADPGPGFAAMPEGEVTNVFGWSPGKVPVLEPASTAWALEEGSDLIVQLHLVSSAAAETVQPTIGLFFASTPPTRTPIVVKLESKTIDIPAGRSDHLVEDSYVLPADVELVSIYPHAHYLAREMRGEATLPDGTVTSLLWIKQWDSRWQDQYRYHTPLFLPKGTTVTMRFTYDNSEANRNNRHRPPQRVTWGPLSTDEMGALWLEVVPRRSEDVGLLAQDYFRRARLTDVAWAEMKLRASPDDPAAHNLLAMKYVDAARVPEAQRHLEEALRLKPDDAEAHSNLGTVLLMQNRLAEATRHLREAVRLKPGDDRARFNLGNGLNAAGQADDAMREFRRAVQSNPENADAHFNLAMLLGPRNRLDEAIAHLRRVIEINPRSADAHRNLAVALGLQGKVDEATRSARTALRLAPDSVAARQHLERLLAARGGR